MGLHSDKSAILSAVIFNALIIIALIPLALKGVAYRPVGAAALLRRNLAIYGLGGVIVPFVGIKIIDVVGRRPASGLRNPTCSAKFAPPIVLLALFTLLTGLAYPLAITGDRAGRCCRGRPTAVSSTSATSAGRLGADRAELRRRQIFPRPPVGDAGAGSGASRRFLEDDRRALQRREFDRLQSRPDLAEADRPREGRRRRQARRRLDRRRSPPTP